MKKRSNKILSLLLALALCLSFIPLPALAASPAETAAKTTLTNQSQELNGTTGEHTQSEAVFLENDFTIENGVLTKYNGPGGDVTIPDGVTSIGWGAFADCTNLTSVNIPSSVTDIDDDAFHGCTRLTDLTIPRSVTEIGSYAFEGCTSMTAFQVDANNATYASVDGVLFNKDKSILWMRIKSRKTKKG